MPGGPRMLVGDDDLLDVEVVEQILVLVELLARNFHQLLVDGPVGELLPPHEGGGEPAAVPVHHLHLQPFHRVLVVHHRVLPHHQRPVLHVAVAQVKLPDCVDLGPGCGVVDEALPPILQTLFLGDLSLQLGPGGFEFSLDVEVANGIVALLEEAASAQALLPRYHLALLREVLLLAGSVAPVLPRRELGHRRVRPLHRAGVLQGQEHTLLEPSGRDNVTQLVILVHEGLFAGESQPHHESPLHLVSLTPMTVEADKGLLGQA